MKVQQTYTLWWLHNTSTNTKSWVFWHHLKHSTIECYMYYTVLDNRYNFISLQRNITTILDETVAASRACSFMLQQEPVAPLSLAQIHECKWREAANVSFTVSSFATSAFNQDDIILWAAKLCGCRLAALGQSQANVTGFNTSSRPCHAKCAKIG